jgi:hypothetical protein
VKSLGHASFFRVFDRYVRPSVSVDEVARWEVDGVDWSRVRHGYASDAHSFTLEVATGVRAGKRGWTLMVVRETWWAGANRDAVKTREWTHVVNGARADILAWFTVQERGT